MQTFRTLRTFVVAVALSCLSTALSAAIQLTPVVPSGLASPVFVGHAGDGSNRLFIIEQAGMIRVLQPSSSAPTTFLDIRTKILSGGERGLLGLAFHPQYATNGRFFVYYTRTSDGTIVIAEYGVSGDANVANTTEKVLLTIPHPTNANHNGGMLAFGSDGFLYAGVGDGGSGNDPPNNAQNINMLLGKILRIDIDHPDPAAGTSYSSPPDNPYFGATPGSDEIFSIGWRNPWRFSFDRLTHQQWVADVGQGSREEVDTPVVKGGNYGWRVYEGFNCTGVDQSKCDTPPVTYLFPIFDYGHSGGRCSITGGYVYRGTQGAVPQGTYLYGDYCSGEIFAWDGATQSVLLDTTMNVSSFGEDEAGEVYVVNLGGSLSKIAAVACAFDIAPTSQSFASGGGTGTVNVTATAGCAWTAVANPNTPWVHITSGASGSGNGTVSFSVDANTLTSSRSTNLTIAGKTFTVTQAGATCTYGITPTSQTFSASAGTGTVAVTAGSGCPWTAATNATWIRVTSGASGSGNGNVGYSVDANTSSSQRSGTLTIAGSTFTVTQSGAVTCTYAIAPTSASYARTGGSGSVTVTAPSGCNWTAVRNVDWITITSGASGSGNGVVAYSVGPYGGPSKKRNGTMTIAGKTFSIQQTK